MTSRTEARRAVRSDPPGTSNLTRDSVRVRFARTIRWAMVETGTRKPRAISSVVRPPSTRRVRATRASFERIGWQAMNMSPRRSSPTSSSIAASGSMSSRARSRSRPISSCLRSSVWRRRIRSIARCFAVPISQAPGFSGTPEVGHCSSAATRASCASSSAVPMSPTMRASPAMSRADSIRQIASIARCASVAAVSPRLGRSSASALRGAMARAPSHPLGIEDLTNLVGPRVEGCPLKPLEGLVDRAHLPQPVPGHELLGLRERPVNDRALLALEPKALAVRARVEAAIPHHHPRLDQLFVELLELGHRLRRWGLRRLALMVFLCQHQYTHLCLLLVDLIRRLLEHLIRILAVWSPQGLTPASNGSRPFRHHNFKLAVTSAVGTSYSGSYRFAPYPPFLVRLLDLPALLRPVMTEPPGLKVNQSLSTIPATSTKTDTELIKVHPVDHISPSWS